MILQETIEYTQLLQMHDLGLVRQNLMVCLITGLFPNNMVDNMTSAAMTTAQSDMRSETNQRSPGGRVID